MCAPTGFGKSLCNVAAAMMTGKRTVILTSTKGLQDQYNGDFSEVLKDIRGMANYPCPKAQDLGLPGYTVVADAPCQIGYRCPLRSNGECGYYARYREAQYADVVVTNYQCWMHDRDKRDNLCSVRPVEMLICDEGHEVVSEICSFMGVEIERNECLSMGTTWPDRGLGWLPWQEWGKQWAGAFKRRVEELVEEYKDSEGRVPNHVHKEVKECRRLIKKLDKVAQMSEGWMVEELGERMRSVRFEPLWPMRYAESALFRGVPKIVLVSATVRPKTAELLGIGQGQASLDFREYPSSFRPHLRPVISVPGVRMNHRTTDSELIVWLRKMDSIIGKRLDRKGIVHCVSYDRMHLVRNNSEHKGRMLWHSSDNRAQVVERFKRAPAGTVLVSPSVDTGYDFAGDLARYQIIGKVPFIDSRSPVMKARVEEDAEYGMYLTAQTLVQACGRIVRSEDDWGESLVLDSSFRWFYPKYRQFFPKWFQDAVRFVDVTPEPLQPKEENSAR